ncbi:MAG: cytochrome c oxidase accessory protein CcoG, partial [Alphaproteobacteria bacterium]|nr:cytochrome c oxidase accessory protein CcoG [Alphaproteobacteria bacterium]
MVQIINTVDDKQPVDRHDVEAVNKAENRSLYASRVKIQPKDVSGTFRRLKWALLTVLLGIYYISPWLRWDRGPGAPDQAILIDLANRRFYFFFIEIWP